MTNNNRCRVKRPLVFSRHEIFSADMSIRAIRSRQNRMRSRMLATLTLNKKPSCTGDMYYESQPQVEKTITLTSSGVRRPMACHSGQTVVVRPDINVTHRIVRGKGGIDHRRFLLLQLHGSSATISRCRQSSHIPVRSYSLYYLLSPA